MTNLPDNPVHAGDGAWVLVPREPTPEMREAAMDVLLYRGDIYQNNDGNIVIETITPRDIFHSMLSAAPALPAVEGGEFLNRLRSAIALGTSMGVRGRHPSNIYNLAGEAADLIQSLLAQMQKVEGPRFEGVAKRKLNDLISRGWEISGYSIFKNGEHGLVTHGGFVGWFTVADRQADAAEATIATLQKQLETAREALESAFDFLGGVNGAVEIRDEVLAALSSINTQEGKDG